jgi:cyclopropane-fatty-acyl-phospholipid synthase
MNCDRMIVRDDLAAARTSVYGSADGELVGEITVRDTRAYTAVVTEGSIGLGRGYIEGWWDSPDPVTAVRVIIRNMAPIDAARNRAHRLSGWATDRIRAACPRRGRSGDREDIAAHYDLGNPFFELFLDETMTYSSAVFASMDSTLAEASLHKYDLLLTKLGVDSNHRLLEIGTGWGGLAIRAAENTGCRVTTTTISAEQLAEAARRVDAAGYASQIELLDTDWRDLSGSFDRVISIEMIEAVDRRDYDAFFATIERCMKPDGLAAIQAICLPDNRYDRAKNTEDFIRRFVFPNGCLSSIGAISKSVSRSTGMQIVGVEDFSVHYAETLRRWRIRFEAHLDDAHALGLDERFCRMWRFYLAYCEAGFRERHCTVNQIVLAGRDWRGSIG